MPCTCGIVGLGAEAKTALCIPCEGGKSADDKALPGVEREGLRLRPWRVSRSFIGVLRYTGKGAVLYY